MDGNICNTILIDDELDNICGSSVDKILSYLSDLENINSDIQHLLEDEGWVGDAHDKCVAAISMMEQYRVDLESACDSFRVYINKVVKNAGDFVDFSDKVKSIKM